VTEPTYTQASARFVRETTPTDEAVASLRRRVVEEVGAEGSVADLAGTELGPAPGAAPRVARRLRASRRRRRWSPGWFGPGPTSPWRLPVAAAAAAVLIAAVWFRPAPQAPSPVVAPELPPTAPPLDAPEVEPDVPPTDAAVEAPSEDRPAAPEAAVAPTADTPGPSPDRDPEPAPGPDGPDEARDAIATLDAVGESALSSFGEWTAATPDPRVRLRYRGDGVLDAGGDDFEVRWGTGRIEVDVDPQSGVRLAVVTAEARASIVGTRFSVDTDADGTRVVVTSGVVRVRCDGEEPRDVRAERTVTCATRDPRKLVKRAMARFHAPDRSCEDVLTGLTAGLDRWPAEGYSDHLFGSALWTQVLCLHELDRRAEAKTAAETYIDLGLTGHREDARSYLARWGSP